MIKKINYTIQLQFIAHLYHNKRKRKHIYKATLAPRVNIANFRIQTLFFVDNVYRCKKYE